MAMDHDPKSKAYSGKSRFDVRSALALTIGIVRYLLVEVKQAWLAFIFAASVIITAAEMLVRLLSEYPVIDLLSFIVRLMVHIAYSVTLINYASESARGLDPRSLFRWNRQHFYWLGGMFVSSLMVVVLLVMPILLFSGFASLSVTGPIGGAGSAPAQGADLGPVAADPSAMIGLAWPLVISIVAGAFYMNLVAAYACLNHKIAPIHCLRESLKFWRFFAAMTVSTGLVYLLAFGSVMVLDTIRTMLIMQWPGSLTVDLVIIFAGNYITMAIGSLSLLLAALALAKGLVAVKP
ncbi:MAG: hypothetical protein AAF418_00865 [Pseudomonadota bacterium]